jgi:hypothetical protein
VSGEVRKEKESNGKAWNTENVITPRGGAQCLADRIETNAAKCLTDGRRDDRASQTHHIGHTSSLRVSIRGDDRDRY